MATYSRVTPTGWAQGDDAAASARVTPSGWLQVNAAGGGGSVPSITAVTASAITSTSVTPVITLNFP